MKWVLFYHSLLSDWNHGNAHFLRGVVRELRRRGHEVRVMEPRNGWSLSNLVKAQGAEPLREVETMMELEGLWKDYDPDQLDLHRILEDADIVVAHEWNPPELIRKLGEYRRDHPSIRLLFHDTHHRGVSEPEAMKLYCFEHYDGALVFGQALREVYITNDWARRVWVWHEAADTSWFYPRETEENEKSDLVWIGNWGDDERTEELRTFLFGPVRELGLSGSIHGVRYPDFALREVSDAGLRFQGWLPNHRAPETFARHRFTVHVPRRFYSEVLPGIPTIRVFEALACGIPLICAPWSDSERLFRPGDDFLMVENAQEMRDAMHAVSTDSRLATRLIWNGLQTIQSRHTCIHRVNELEAIVSSLRRNYHPTEITEKAVGMAPKGIPS